MMEGTTIDRKSLDFVSGSLRMLGDRILVKPLPLKLSQIIHAAWSGKTVRGQVVSVGPGEHPNRYNPDRSKTWKSKAFRKTEVKIGDCVHLGGMELEGYSFPRIMLNGIEHIIASEKDICGIEI